MIAPMGLVLTDAMRHGSSAVHSSSSRGQPISQNLGQKVQVSSVVCDNPRFFCLFSRLGASGPIQQHAF